MCVITEKKLQLNIARLCCHDFLSLVVFWLGGGRAPWAPAPGYAYAAKAAKKAFTSRQIQSCKQAV